jgi:hypothetical protein
MLTAAQGSAGHDAEEPDLPSAAKAAVGRRSTMLTCCCLEFVFLDYFSLSLSFFFSLFPVHV